MATIRARSLKHLRMRGRNDSGEENVPLDLTREPRDILREILQNMAKLQGVSNMRKVGHLNNFIKLICHVNYSEEKLGFTYEDIIMCLRLALLNEVKEVRAAGLRAFRYFIRDSNILQKVLRLKVDYLICRCIDIQQNNEMERTQALRLIRKMISVNAFLFPSSLANCVIAIGNDGLQEGDRMFRACIAIVCELALQNPEIVARRGGLNTMLKHVIDCQLSRINEALITTVLHLLNHPKTRQYVRPDVELERILAPYTDFHYRHNPETAEGQLKEDREFRFRASKMAIVATFRSWAGIISLCRPGNSGVQSLIGVLCIPNTEIRGVLLEVLFDVFRLPLPTLTEDFIEALQSVYPSRFQDSWRLSDGFVAAEANSVLPHRARSRPDLMDNYLGLVLAAFISNGLMEGLIEVITNSEDPVSIRGTILLGELLHMANTILPHSHSQHLHCLPKLMNMAASFDILRDKRQRASEALNGLKRVHEMKKRGPKPHSLYLDHIVRKAKETHQKRDQHVRVQKDIVVLKDTEEALMVHLRDCQVLNHKENLKWNWNLIGTILKWPNVNLKNYKDEQLQRFVRRLLYFYKPSSKLYGNLELDFSMAKQLTVVGCQLTEFLLESEEDGQAFLEELVKDIVQWLKSASGLKSERSLQNNGLLNTLSQHYFLFFGTLSCHPHGVKMLEKCNVFQCLLNLCSLKNQDHLLKLTVSSLDYSRDGLARVILSKVLTASTDSCRLYATKHLRVLLRANVEFFSNWGVELLVTQLYDKTKSVSTEALEILDEACEDKANLHALIQMKPALSHLGDKGLLLLLRFLSIPKGFSYLNERGYVTKQLESWQKVSDLRSRWLSKYREVTGVVDYIKVLKEQETNDMEYNLKYVDLTEEQLNEALTTYRKPINGDNYVRRSNQRLQRPHVFLPVHLYGQLVHHKTGCNLLEVQSIVPDLSYTVRSPMLDNWEGIKQLKAALWALGNIGSSNWGLNLLQEETVIPDIIALAQHCEVLSIRGTCIYVLGMLSKTKQGCDILKHHNWDTVRHSRRQTWPVVPDDVEQMYSELSSVPSTLSLNSESTSSRHNSESESTPTGMFIIEDDRCCNNSTSPLFFSEDTEQPFYEKPSKDKDRSPFTLLTTSKFVKNRFLNSLTLPSKKLRSSSDPKGGKPLFENKLGLRRNRTVTEPCSNSDFSPGDGFGPIFNVPKIHTLRLANSYVGSKNIDDTGSTPSIGENDLKLPKIYGIENHRENSSRERLLGDISTGTNFKSRSLSFNTDTTTSGISSMSSSPSRETIDTTNIDTDCGSLSTVVSTNTVKTKHPSVPHSNHLPISKSNSVSLVPPGSFHTLPRRAQSLKAPSIAAIKSLAEYNICYTSSRDAFGYATLKRLQQQRMHPSLSHSEALASPAKDVLFTDTITMKTGSLDSRLTPNRFTRALSYASLDKEDLLSPINQNTLHRSSSVRSMVSNATYGCSDDYIGLALPMDVNEIFQVKDIPYFQKKTIPPSDDRAARISFPDNGDVKNPFQALRQQISLSEILNSCDSEASRCLDNPEDTGLPEHTDNNCLYCLGMVLLGCHNQANSAFTLADLPDIPLSDWCGLAICNHLEVVSHSSKYSGISGCSDAVSQSSTSSTKSTELVIGKFTASDTVFIAVHDEDSGHSLSIRRASNVPSGGKTIPEDAPVRRIKVRKEILRLVINLSSSVGTKGHETGLLTIKEKFPHVFDDICLFSEISYMLAQCTFRLSSRRFIHELFQDIYFQRMHEVAAIVLAKPPKPMISEPPAES